MLKEPHLAVFCCFLWLWHPICGGCHRQQHQLTKTNLGSGPAATSPHRDRKSRKASGFGTPGTCPAPMSGERSPNELWKWYKMLLLTEECTWRWGPTSSTWGSNHQGPWNHDFAASSKGRESFCSRELEENTKLWPITVRWTLPGHRKEIKRSGSTQASCKSRASHRLARRKYIRGSGSCLMCSPTHLLLPTAPNFPPGTQRLLSRHVGKEDINSPNIRVSNYSGPN